MTAENEPIRERTVHLANSERCPWWLERVIRRVATRRIPRQRANEFDDEYVARMRRNRPDLTLEDIGFIETEES